MSKEVSLIGKRAYKKEELLEKIKGLYAELNIPLNNTLIVNKNGMPTTKVFDRLFGSWQNACIEAEIPYENRKVRTTDMTKSSLAKKNDRLGEEKINNAGCLMKITEYNHVNDIVVEFQDENKFQLHATYGNWKKGNLKNPYRKSLYNVGCIGNAIAKVDGIKKNSYKVWYSMLQRCYKECFDAKPTYEQCTVCQEWLTYEYFQEWYDNNFYSVEDEVMMLDKDILLKGNTVYSPETCVFVPQSINKLFTKRQLHRGAYYIGVTYDNRCGTYRATCNINGKSKYLGSFNKEIDAFLAYKKEKEKTVKKMADKYKSSIPLKLYKKMYEYEVDIDD